MLTMYWRKVLPVGKIYFTLFNFENNASRQNSSAFQKMVSAFAIIGTNKIVTLTVTRTRWPCRGTIQNTTAL